jgi:UDP-N-acetylmuramoyl-tripeptide--D-alanyl-D-alanine ligase
VVRLRERAPGAQVVTFGLSESADVRATETKILFDTQRRAIGMQAVVQVEGESLPLEIKGAIGAHALLPALAAVAVGRALAKPLPEILAALAHYDPPRGRMHLIEGIKNTMLIDDTYNSSPAAVHAALETLALMPSARKVAILGDMLELGRHSVEEHRKAGAMAAKQADLLITVGFRARDIAQGALDAGMGEEKILQFERSSQVAEELKNLLQEGDLVLVKGSQSMRMEKIVEEVMQDPAHAADLLVRQDEEWKKKV